MFKFKTRSERSDSVVVEKYAPEEELYILSFDKRTRKPCKRRILELSIHKNVDLLELRHKHNIFTPFYITPDHSVFVYDKQDDNFIRTTPKEVVGKERYDFIRVQQNGLIEYINCKELELQEIGKGTAYDFTVEGTEVFAINEGVIVYDTMAVYAMLSREAQDSLDEIYDPKLQIHPGKLKVLGVDNELASALFWLTKDEPDPENCIKEFDTLIDVMKSVKNPADLFDNITIRIKSNNTYTTLGRAYLSGLLQHNITKPLRKSQIQSILTSLYFKYVMFSKDEKDHKKYASIIHILFRLLAKIANKFTISGVDIYDEEIDKLVQDAKKRFRTGEINISQLETIIDEIKQKAIDKISVFQTSYQAQTKLHKTLQQMIMMRGLVMDITGKVHGPILGSYLDGLTDDEIFESGYGSRKGIVDKTQSVKHSGYLLRKLVYVVQDKHMILKNNRPDFCGTDKFLEYKLEKISDLETYFLLRYIITPDGEEYFVDYKTLNTLKNKLKENDIIKVYSPLYCKSETFCKKCVPKGYDRSPFIGIVSAQSLCEDLTQSLLRTFHTGGSTNENIFKHNHFRIEDNEILANVPLTILQFKYDEDLFIEYKYNNEIYTEYIVGIEDVEFVYENELPKDFEKNDLIATATITQSSDYKQLTVAVNQELSSRESTIESIYEIMKLVNCQSLYKEVIISQFFLDPNNNPARLNGYTEYRKVTMHELLYNKYILSLAFGNPSKFVSKVTQNQSLYEEKIIEEVENSPLAALCLWDINALSDFLKEGE